MVVVVVVERVRSNKMMWYSVGGEVCGEETVALVVVVVEGVRSNKVRWYR